MGSEGSFCGVVSSAYQTTTSPPASPAPNQCEASRGKEEKRRAATKPQPCSSVALYYGNTTGANTTKRYQTGAPFAEQTKIMPPKKRSRKKKRERGIHLKAKPVSQRLQ